MICRIKNWERVLLDGEKGKRAWGGGGEYVKTYIYIS